MTMAADGAVATAAKAERNMDNSRVPTSSSSSPSSVERKCRDYPIGIMSKGVWVEGRRMDPDLFMMTPFYRQLVTHVMISNGEIKDRIEKLAYDIHQHYQSYSDLTLVCTLKGACVFFEHLTFSLRKIAQYAGGFNHRSAYIPEYIRVSSYIGKTRDILKTNSCQNDEALERLNGKNVLVVEDILDSGKTLLGTKDLLLNRAKVAEFKSVVLFAKRIANWNNFEPDWIGFDIPNEFIVGFGCDVDDNFRDLDHLCYAAV